MTTNHNALPRDRPPSPQHHQMAPGGGMQPPATDMSPRWGWGLSLPTFVLQTWRSYGATIATIKIIPNTLTSVMENKNQEYAIRETLVTSKIYVVRNKKIMLDRDLAELYEVETRVLNQAVSRNIERFPEEFMFQLTSDEFEILMSQIVISSWGGTRKMPFAFTGVAMLSSVFIAKELFR